jgi:hypothetical protein
MLKDLSVPNVKGPQRGPKGFYFLLILLANAKAGRDSNKRMLQKLAVEDAEAIIEDPLPELLPAAKSAVRLTTKTSPYSDSTLQLLHLVCAPPVVLGKSVEMVYPAT